MRRWLVLVLLLPVLLPVRGLRGVAAASEVSLALSAQPATVASGSQVLYTLKLTNAGNQDIAGLVAGVTLPGGFAYVPGSTTVALDGGPLPGPEPAVVGSGLTWNRLLLPGRRGTVYGIHTFVQDKCDTTNILYQLDRARELAGSGAHVKQLFHAITAATAGPLPCWVQFVDAAYNRDLIPVLRLEGEFAGPNWAKPQPDPDGSYASIAAAFKRVVAGLPRREGKPLYVEVWNEPNLGLEWGGTPNPLEYGRFLVDVSAALRSLGDPRIVILNGALSPGGEYNNLAFIDALATVPGALQAFDVWATHPYPGNRPPDQNLHADPALPYPWLSVDSYKLELERLAAHGRSGLRVMLTETGYLLGAADLYSAAGLPPIDEWRRADYIKRAFRDYWSNWPEVIAVCPFELVDPVPNSPWRGWDWLYPNDGGHHPQYDEVAALPKPQPSPGVLTISFRATAWAAPGTYAGAANAVAGGVTLAAAGGLAPVTVQAGLPTPTPVPVPPEGPPASQLLRNTGFEADTPDWQVLISGRGGYSTAQAHTGARSFWLGLPAGSGNAYAFSSAQQEVSPPPTGEQSRLSFWYKPVSTDPAGDQLKVLVQDAGGIWRTLGYLPLNVQGWTRAILNTTGYAATTVRLTVVNDGFGGQTTVYVDDASWTTSAFEFRTILPLVYRGPYEATAASQARAAVGAEPAPVGPAVVASVELPPAAGAYRALAIDPASGLAYAAAEDGLWRFDPAGEQPPRRLRPGAGYQALLLDSDGRLWASDWESGAVIALDPQSGRELARSERLLRPSGLAAYGDRLFVAESDSAQVVVLDRRTCGIIQSEPVGPAPYALAVDPQGGRVWVANAGGRSLTVLDAESGSPLGAVQLDGLGHPQGLAVDALRRRVYATYLLAPRYHALAVIDADSLHVERVLRGNLQHPLLGAYGVAVEPRTGRVVLSDVTGLIAVDPQTLAVEELAPGEGFALPFGLVADPARSRVLSAGGERVHILTRR